MVEQLLPRNKIYLQKEITEKYPSVQLNEKDESLLNFRQQKKLRLICYHCGDHSLLDNRGSNDTDFWHRCASYEHFYCNYCFIYSLKKFNHTCSKGEPILDERKTIEHLLYCKIKFECQWEGCKKIFGGCNLKNHEISCEAQPKRECPLAGCQWSGRIDQMEKHFTDHENSKIILTNMIHNMESGKEYYLWILRKFVLVQYKLEDLGEVFEHNIKLEVCKEVLEGVKPVGLMIDYQTLLKKIEGNDVVKITEKQVNLFVYFEDLK